MGSDQMQCHVSLLQNRPTPPSLLLGFKPNPSAPDSRHSASPAPADLLLDGGPGERPNPRRAASGSLRFTRASLLTASPRGPLECVHSSSEHTWTKCWALWIKTKSEELPTLQDLPALSILQLLFLNQRLLPSEAFLPPKQHEDDGLISSNRGRGSGVRDCQGQDPSSAAFSLCNWANSSPLCLTHLTFRMRTTIPTN